MYCYGLKQELFSRFPHFMLLLLPLIQNKPSFSPSLLYSPSLSRHLLAVSFCTSDSLHNPLQLGFWLHYSVPSYHWIKCSSSKSSSHPPSQERSTCRPSSHGVCPNTVLILVNIYIWIYKLHLQSRFFHSDVNFPWEFVKPLAPQHWKSCLLLASLSEYKSIPAINNKNKHSSNFNVWSHYIFHHAGILVTWCEHLIVIIIYTYMKSPLRNCF